ncbi:hypothetical protein GCM10010466_67100 [Planomonospora alba]|uniref:Uncharacterized protein n=1 Tax=Planomonospora alba TaxID=161354 RepID=A0ABP6P4D1_9ACTN
MGGVGDVRQRSLEISSRNGPDAVAVMTALEFHPGLTAVVPARRDQPERSGDPGGANIAFCDPQCLFQRRPQARFQGEGRFETDVVEQTFTQPGRPPSDQR